MSGIETGRFEQRIDPLPVRSTVNPKGGAGSIPPASRIQRRGEEADRVETALQPKRASQAEPVHGPVTEDLAAMQFIASDRLIADLARIEGILHDALASSPSTEDSQAIDLGRQAITEQIRRLLLVQSASDSLVTRG